MRCNATVAAALTAILLLALPAARCESQHQAPLLTSLAVEPDSVHLTMLDVPRSWPSETAAPHHSLRLPGGFLKIIGASRSGMSAVDGLVIDVSITTCIARVQLAGDMLSSDDRTCFADTEVSFSQRDVLDHLSCSEAPLSPCTCSLPFNRSISPSAAHELDASGVVVERGCPYVLVSTVVVSGYLLDDGVSGIEIFSHVFDRLASNWVPAQYVVFRNLHRYAETHAQWLRVVSAAQQPQTEAISAAPRAAHRIQGRFTSQELFYLDHLFSISPTVDCPPGMRLRSIGGHHAACVLDDLVRTAGGCDHNTSLALWFSSDMPPAYPSFNGGKVYVCDCSLGSPALHQPLAFIPWCLRSVPSSLSTHFFPRSSLNSLYSQASSASWIMGTLASDAVDVKNTHLQVLQIQGYAGLRAVVHCLAGGALAHETPLSRSTENSKGKCGADNEHVAVTLMRLEVDAKNIEALEEILRGDTGFGYVQQIIVTFGLFLPYSSVLVDGDGDQECVLARRWPHVHAHCNECVNKTWLLNEYTSHCAFDVGVERVGRVMRLAAQNYAVAAWRTLGQASVEVTWVLRSLYAHNDAGLASRAPDDISHIDGTSCTNSANVKHQGRKNRPMCIEGGIDTCGLAFCSDAQAPIECIGLPKLLAFVRKVFDVCARRWWAIEREGKVQCPGLRRDISFGGDGSLLDDSLRDPDGRAWTFVLKVADNPSLLKLISYGMWHHVRSAKDCDAFV